MLLVCYCVCACCVFQNFGKMPEEATKHYGEGKFTAMMMAKVVCLQMAIVLFQDVDIVWYKDPGAWEEFASEAKKVHHRQLW